jgi:HEAT repeat protein
MSQESIPSFIEALQSPQEMVRVQAAKSLGALGQLAVQAIPALVRAVGTDGSINVSREASTAIQRIGAAGIPVLLEIVRNPQSDKLRQYTSFFRDVNEFRNYAADELANLGPPSLPQLLTLLDDPDEAVRDVAIEALPRVGPAAEAAVPKLTTFLFDSDWSAPTAISLAQIAALAEDPKQSSAFKSLLRALKEGNVLVRRHVVSAFEFMGDKVKVAIPALIEATQDADEEVREKSARLLEQLNTSQKV